ncbi:Methyltransferase OMS1, mitochondrial [Erysiphe neolycopersici]|uniref:Methyltransferase OMS1, mitochondrial n=1 Tax=Erysiphe neolycopersici TaxID=212602 RepID=A0A420I335_9PEZI|nr:Methyltransferase OMS1, mitochondrial [Erysiphe neolycopersici]
MTFIITKFYKTESFINTDNPLVQEDVSSRYNSIAHSFDDTVDSNEYWLGITSLRKKLVQQAHGHVLEVSVGTGRNLTFYDWKIQGYNGVGRPDTSNNIKKGSVISFTAIDISPEMLKIARKKLDALFPSSRSVRWIQGDAGVAGIIPAPPVDLSGDDTKKNFKYDTIVQTMGLCSVKDPVGLLRNLGEYIKEEDGRILLLEHGRGRWKWLNFMLDKTAKEHAQAFGCWWNRDIQNLVEKSGLEIVKIMTPKWWHGGTTWWIELKKPNSKSSEKEVQTTLQTIN